MSASGREGRHRVAPFGLEEPANALMRTPLPEGSGHIHGPEFRCIEDEP
ncbi:MULTISPECIES: hypothetical protein [Streptomyces]|nr:hypothetical protein [Streptomyces sp. CL12-4]MCG8970529.1 hypothetical protein [Streptomyces sp. CL12-4]